MPPGRTYNKNKMFGNKKVSQPDRFVPKSLVIDGVAYPLLNTLQLRKNVSFTTSKGIVSKLRKRLMAVPKSDRLSAWGEFYKDAFKEEDSKAKDGTQILTYIYNLANSDKGKEAIAKHGDGVLFTKIANEKRDAKRRKKRKERELADANDEGEIDLDLTDTAKKPKPKTKISQPKDLREFLQFVQQEGLLEDGTENFLKNLMNKAVEKGFKFSEDLKKNKSALALASIAFTGLYGSMGLSPISVPAFNIITGLSLLIGDKGLKNQTQNLLEDNEAKVGDRKVLDSDKIGGEGSMKILSDVIKYSERRKKIMASKPNTMRGEKSKETQLADLFQETFNNYDDKARTTAMTMLTNLSKKAPKLTIKDGLVEVPKSEIPDDLPETKKSVPPRRKTQSAPQQTINFAVGGQGQQTQMPPTPAPAPPPTPPPSPKNNVRMEINPKEEIQQKAEELEGTAGMGEKEDIIKKDDIMDVGIHNEGIQKVATANDVDFTFRKTMTKQFNPNISKSEAKIIIENIIKEYGFLIFVQQSKDNFSIEEAYELMTLKEILLENIRTDRKVKQSLIRLKGGTNIINNTSGSPSFENGEIGFILNAQSLNISPQNLVQQLSNNPLQQPSQSAPQTAPAPAPASAPAPAPAPVQYNVKGRLKTIKKDKKDKKRRVGIRPAKDVVFRGRIVNPVAYENLRNEPENQPGKELIFRNNKKEMKINRLNIFR
jgi:hypothetical protein